MAAPTVFPILPLNTEGQELTPIDASSVSSISIKNTFNVTEDFIEAYIYDVNNNFISRLTTNYSVLSGIVSGSSVSQLTLDPVSDLLKNNYTQGTYNVNYNFLSSLLAGNPLFTITEISPSRTELRINNSSFNAIQLQEIVSTVNTFLNSTETFQGYYLDFGSDDILLGVNITSDNSTILVKLYEPLPDNLQVNSTLNLVEKKAEPAAYNISFPEEEIPTPGPSYIKGPNFGIKASQQTNTSTEYQTHGSLFNGSTSLTNQLKSVLVERRVELNTDYTEYSNFVFFSSVEQRLINFYYKASLIEDYTNQISTLNTLTLTAEVSASKQVYQEKINDLILNFDGYDYFLYYDSGSKSWPKSNTTKPYPLYSTGSTQALTWYNEQLASASLYDEFNQNYIYNIYPSYITEDSDNEQFRLFNEMVAQMFDQIWLYTQNIKNRQDGDNRLSEGISIDLAADALRSYGISLYESNFSNVDLYTTYLGVTADGSTLPPTGSELITNYVTASADTIPFNDAQKLIYKRLYHNLPYILKKKGTVSGLRVLLNCFGIPDTLIRINEFGGKDKNTNTWDNWQYQFNYAYNATGSNFISSSFVLNSAWNSPNNRPSSVAFRFKPEANYPTTGSQTLWSLDSGQVKLLLEYTGSNLASGSYSGSITNPYNKYGSLKFVVGSTTSASVYLPFFNGDWWSVLITSGSTAGYTIYAKSNTSGNTINNTIGYQASSSIDITTNWSGSLTSIFGNVFSGSLQEIRYYKTVINESTFNDYVMNPYSIEGNRLNSSADELVFRATLGGELYTGSISTHPKNTGVWQTTSSFVGISNFYYSNTPAFYPNYEYIYFDQVPTGIQNPVSGKIKTTQAILPVIQSAIFTNNKVLSAFTSIQQNKEEDEKYTPDVNYVEVALSPTIEINEDINSSLGYFNIGEYIGDPREISSSVYTYPSLDSLSQTFFEKYSQTYNWTDFLRIIKYFDNAVFRMLKDFIPARAGVATGAVIKQHLLERNRQRPAQITYTEPYYTGSVTSLPRDYQTGSIEVFTGGAGGSVNALTGISQSWTSSILTKAGLVTEVESSQYEFFNGEYSGSRIECQLSYSLNTTPLLNNVSSSRLSTVYEDVDYLSDGYRPVNLLLIQSGSASLAPVQDSNYAATSSWSQLRYEGVKNTGQYNTGSLFASQSIAPGYPVDNFSNYFARFSYDAGADPQYPGGGIFKLTELVSIDGTRIPLTGDNKYLSFVSNIFKSGRTATAYGRNVSVVKTVNNLTIVEGGAIYETILAKSGSLPAGTVKYDYNVGTTFTFTDVWLSSSLNTNQLSDASSGAVLGFLSPLLQATDPTYGSNPLITLGIGYQIYSPTLGSTLDSTSGGIKYQDTYLPLRTGDFLRLGAYTGVSTAIDNNFSAGGLYYIKSIDSIGSPIGVISRMTMTPALQYTAPDNALQSSMIIITQATEQFRFFRRIPNETWVVTSLNAEMNVDPAVGGLLIPDNFNPSYDPISIARRAGIEI
jgi:hypothetical protein